MGIAGITNPVACDGLAHRATITNSGTGHARGGGLAGKQLALDRARADADEQNGTDLDTVVCAQPCGNATPAISEEDPNTDSGDATYTPSTTPAPASKVVGYSCTVTRKKLVTFTCTPARSG